MSGRSLEGLGRVKWRRIRLGEWDRDRAGGGVRVEGEGRVRGG